VAENKKIDVPVEEKSGNKALLQKEIKASYAREISLYEDFFNKVTGHAKTHRQISINNLSEAEKRIKKLKEDAAKIADSIFFHDEEIVVERSRIISDTESFVRDFNQDVMNHDRNRFPETIQTIDYLSKALLTSKKDFLAFYSRSYLDNVLSMEDYFEYYMQKSQAFQVILDRHQTEIYDLFVKLDHEIKSMDDAITNIIRTKNRKVNDIEAFFEGELKHYADNQLSFSAESDPTSVEIQALSSDKINQYNAFADHAANLNLRIQRVIEEDYVALYQKVLNHLLQARSYAIINRFDLFDDPVKYKIEYKQKLLNAEATRARNLPRLLHTYQMISRWQRDVKNAEALATRMLRPQARRKEQILKLSEETSIRETNKLELYLNAYLEVMKFDPFLAQAIGDYSSKIVKDEIARLTVQKLNKELKTNIDFDIQATKIKSQINELELVMMNAIKKQLCLQEGELVSELEKIHLFLLEKRGKQVQSSFDILKERHLIERLDKAANEHLAYLLASGNTSRKWMSLVSDELVRNSREKETHNIYVVEAKSELELALKQYDIQAVHFQTMYENEKAYLVMQKSRVDEETKINNEFILTTYLNQMRFAEEQMAFADSEYRIRVDSLVSAVDEERKFHQDQVRIIQNRYDGDIRLVDDDYQAKLYSESHKIAAVSDKKEQKAIALNMEKDRRIRDQRVNLLVQKLAGDEQIAKSQKSLTVLDQELAEAIQSADELREATLREFSDLYDHAKERYETLKPYMENSVNILDPTFYETMVSINDRFRAKIVAAEAELDAKAEALIPHYREVYFTEDIKDNSAIFRTRIDEIMAERELNQNNYQTKLQAIEAVYQTQIASIAREENALEQAMESEAEAVRLKEEQTTAQFKQMAFALEVEGESLIKAHREATTKTINQLTDEYFKSLKTSKTAIDGLSFEFQKVVDGYQEYFRFSEGEKKYRKVLSTIRKAERKKLKNSLKHLNQRFKHYHIGFKKK
jgi:hypothetical protein